MKKFFIYNVKFGILLLLLTKLVFSQVNKVDEICPSGMISYWKFDEFGDVNTFLDSYGGHTALCVDSTRPAESAGLVKQARNFNNKSEIYVADIKDYNWNLHSNFTIELWIKTTQPGTGNKVFIGRPSEDIGMSWWLGYSDNNKAIFSLRDSNNIKTVAEGNKVINDGKWHHIVGIKNDSINVLQLYVDGVEEDKISTFYTGSFTSSSLLYFGTYGNNDYHFNGSIDEVAIYDMALTDAQIKQHYNNGLLGKGYCDEFTTDVNNNINTPVTYSLNQNYPNPFNPSTIISFSIPYSGNVKLNVFSILGENITTLINGFLPPGFYKAEFKNTNLSSGIYFYALQVNNFWQVKKMILEK